MSKYIPATLAIAAMLLASTSLAQGRGELEKSSIKAATDCVAAAALNKPQHHHPLSGRPAQRGYGLDCSSFRCLR